MGASRTPVSKEIKVHERCWFMFSPDMFDRGERKFECPHGRVFMVRVVVKPIEYVVEEMVEDVEEDAGT